MLLRIALACGLALTVIGCASKSSEISASYVSPIMYQNHTCQQLAAEAQGVAARAAAVSGAQDSKRTNDQIATGVAIIVFWPAAFFVGGDGPMAGELANLKGQMVAIEQASIQRNCGISFQRTADNGAAAPVYAPPPPAPPQVVQSAPRGQKKAANRTQQPAPAVQANTYLPPAQPEPPEPRLSEADRTMLQRN